MGLASDNPRTYGANTPLADRPYPLKTDKLFEGQPCSSSGGGNVGLPATGEPFAGFLMQTVDASGAASPGDMTGSFRTKGSTLGDVVGVTGPGNNRALVYIDVTGSNPLTLTSTNNVLCGRISQWVEGTTCWIEFAADQVKEP